MPARPAERALRAVTPPDGPPAGIGTAAASAVAWQLVADACEAALAVDGIDRDDAAALADIRQVARWVAGLGEQAGVDGNMRSMPPAPRPPGSRRRPPGADHKESDLPMAASHPIARLDEDR